MARKRTQAERDKDRERKALKRSLMTEEEKQRERDQAKERMAKRSKQMSPESKEKQRQQNKERMSARRAEDREILEEYWKRNPGTKEKMVLRSSSRKSEREWNRNYRRKIRSNRSPADQEYEKIYNLLCMRKKRKNQSGKEHLLSNLKARKGMRLINEKGYLKPFKQRNFRDIDEVDLWKRFCERGIEYEDLLKKRNPVMGQKVDEILSQEKKERMEKQKKRDKEREEREEKEREMRKEGYWDYNYVMDMFEWVGDNPPSPGNINPDDREPEPEIDGSWDCEKNMTDDDWKELYEKWDAQEREWARQERNSYARKMYHKRMKKVKAKLQEPIEFEEMEQEPGEYEKIREMNIKERNEKLKAAAKEKGFDFTWI